MLIESKPRTLQKIFCDFRVNSKVIFNCVNNPNTTCAFRHERVNPFILQALLEHRHAWTNDTFQNNFGIEHKLLGCGIDFNQHISYIYFLRNAPVSRIQPQSKNKPRHKLFDLSCNSPRQPRFNGTAFPI